jgi:hypothetical protein
MLDRPVEFREDRVGGLSGGGDCIFKFLEQEDRSNEQKCLKIVF